MKYRMHNGKVRAVPTLPDEATVQTPTADTGPPQDPATMDEARQFHEGFLAGATAYAAAVGHSTLKRDNPQLRDVFEAQGWRTIETFERITGRRI